MTRDQLDDLLDASAPAVRTIAKNDVRAMLADARREVPAPKRARRTAVIGGALALLLVGGAGVATASSDWLWSDGLEKPDRSYAYTSPTWGACEIRFSGLDTHNPFIQADVNRIIDEWFANMDVEAAAAPYLDQYLVQLESDQADDPAVIADPGSADVNAWIAHEQALGHALHDELETHGYGSGDLAGADSHSQVHCEGEDWGGGE